MTTTTRDRTQPDAAPESRDTTALGPIVVASDGSSESMAALRAAALLEQRTNAEVLVLSVLEGLPPVAADFGIVVPPLDADDARRARRMEAVRNQVSQIASRVREWKVEVIDGDPPQTIARTARDFNARVITIGLGHHQVLDRLFGRETALHVLRQAHTPVLAVPENFAALPERVVVATDFSPESLNAARVALRLFGTVKSVHVAHVAPRIDVRPDAFAAWMTVFSEGVAPAFGRLKQELGVPPGVEFESRTLSGGAARAVIDLARDVGADLITCGSSGAGLVDRILVGSTATGILRAAQSAVFAVPAMDQDGGRSGAGA